MSEIENLAEAIGKFLEEEIVEDEKIKIEEIETEEITVSVEKLASFMDDFRQDEEAFEALSNVLKGLLFFAAKEGPDYGYKIEKKKQDSWPSLFPSKEDLRKGLEEDENEDEDDDPTDKWPTL